MITSSPSSYIDTHCHLNFDVFDQDRDLVVERALENGIIKIVNPGIDIETSKEAIEFSRKYPQVYAAVGVHPNSGNSWTPDALNALKDLAGEQKVVAIGEIGLDYFRNYVPKETQHAILIQQLDLAADLGLPVIVHNRDASSDILEILREWKRMLDERGSRSAGKPGVMHSFSGDLELATALIALDFKIGITGPVTFRNSQVLQSVVTTVPLESLLIETDSPYLSPMPFRGKRNEPANVRIVAGKIAELKRYSVDRVATVTTEGANELFEWRTIH